jgi:SAM-dependent methyltransferase
LRPWDVLVGSELHPIALRTARTRLGSRAEFVQMDARKILARDVFDLIGAFDVLEHIEEDEEVLAAMREALVPGGGVLIAVPQHPSLWSHVDVYSHHVRRYRPGEMESKVERAGFEVVFSGSYTTVLLPLMAASRLMKRKAADNDPPVGGEVSPPAAINAVLKWLLQREVSATLSGVRFPAGGSRIVAARRRADS